MALNSLHQRIDQWIRDRDHAVCKACNVGYLRVSHGPVEFDPDCNGWHVMMHVACCFCWDGASVERLFEPAETEAMAVRLTSDEWFNSEAFRSQLMRCPTDGWTGQLRDAWVRPDDVVRCPVCGKALEKIDVNKQVNEEQRR